MRSYFAPPESEAFTCWNPSKCHADISDDKLNGTQFEEVSHIVEAERFPACGGQKPFISPQFAQRQLSHDSETRVHDANDSSSWSAVSWRNIAISLIIGRRGEIACQRQLSCSSEMTDNWKPYLCNVNGKLASIIVNLGLRDSAPLFSKPWLLWVWVYFQSPRPDGLSDAEEAPRLYKIEDALTLRLAQACQALLSGRITTEGRREFYFYGETNAGFRKAAAGALTAFDGYKFDLGEQEDSSWGQYLDVLYPSLEDLERIANMDLLDELLKRGDVLTIPREVQHWVSFRTQQSRASFREAARVAGYVIVGETESEGEFSFGMSVTRTQSIEQKLIDQTVIELLRLCRSLNGDYEGWETQVVTQ